MNYGLTRALSMQFFDRLDFHPASCCFRNVPIFAGPEVNFYCAAGNNAVLTLGHMHLAETQLGNEEFCASLYIEGRENGSCGNEVDRHAHTGVLTPNVPAQGRAAGGASRWSAGLGATFLTK